MGIVLSVFLRFLDYDCPFDIFKLFLFDFHSILLCALLYSVILIYLRSRGKRTLAWGSLCSMNYLQNTPQKAKIRPRQTPQKPGIVLNQVIRNGKQFLFHMWHPSSQVDGDIFACKENRCCFCLRLYDFRTASMVYWLTCLPRVW
jgi:hypothetical protein